MQEGQDEVPPYPWNCASQWGCHLPSKLPVINDSMNMHGKKNSQDDWLPDDWPHPPHLRLREKWPSIYPLWHPPWLNLFQMDLGVLPPSVWEWIWKICATRKCRTYLLPHKEMEGTQVCTFPFSRDGRWHWKTDVKELRRQFIFTVVAAIYWRRQWDRQYS